MSIASHLGQSIAVIDTERGSASKYADLFNFDVCELKEFHPGRYVEAIKAADAAGYDVIIVDSLSHAWFAELDMAGGNFSNWAKIKPLERALIDAMLSSSAHLIGTMRSKTEWVMTTTINKSGKEVLTPTKVGTAPMQAAGIEYEFDLAGELSLDHLLTISKSRCPGLSNTTHLNPGRELAELLLMWLADGVEMPETGQSKRDRVKVARTKIGLDVESVKLLMQNHFEASDPTQLTSEQVDELIEMFEEIE
ncbi:MULTISPECIES: AAA family ATPase [Leptolyngbya]|uniref:AAA family ATPase n=1 Tax=Leptolyngbya TaxID=47251 RepID=UPI001F558C6D|nr:AAA family ATPase [Leptolyngbya sp. FACHB-1624]